MSERRRLGTAAANNRYKEMLDGRNLTGDKDAVLRVASRILVHLINQSALLYERGEIRKEDGEPKAALKTILDYNDALLKNLRYCFDGETGDDPLAGIFGRKS